MPNDTPTKTAVVSSRSFRIRRHLCPYSSRAALLIIMRCPETVQLLSQILNRPELPKRRGVNAVDLPILVEALQHLLHLRIGIIRVRDLVTNRPRVAVYLPVVSALVCLIAEEVDLVVD
jgi:hypothetical protein